MPRFRFVNLDGSEPHPLSAVLKWAVVDKLAGRRPTEKKQPPTPQVAIDPQSVATPPARGARLTWIGHASFLVQLDGVSLLIDPIFVKSIGPGINRFVEPALMPKDLPPIDAQLVSHNHRDHLDVSSLQMVKKPVIGGSGLKGFFKAKGLDCAELGWWQETKVGAVTVRFVPSQHWSRRGLNDTNETLWGGFIIEGPSARLYHSGDTAYFDGFSEIGKRSGPIDAAMLPIGAYDPQWFMGKQHMNPEEAVQAYVDLGAREFIAMHWGTFKLTDESLDEPPRKLDAEWSRRALPAEQKHLVPVGTSVMIND